MQSDDLIMLNGGNTASYWRFPALSKRCPVSSCGKVVDDRKVLLAHFNKHHAKKCTYCGMCNGPVICTNYPADLENHYRRIHPNIPFKCDQIQVKEEHHQIEV